MIGPGARERIIGWLFELESRSLDIRAFLDAFISRLRAEGLPLSRLTTSVPTMHPEVFVQNVRWRLSDGLLVNDIPYSITQTADYVASPVEAIRNGAAAIRVRLLPGVELPYRLLNDVRAAGATDYYIVPLLLTHGRRTYLSVATDAAGGFGDDDLALIDGICAALAMRFETASALHATRSLLTVYLGDQAAERVLSGQFQRGTGQELEVAILFCDMRGFSSFSDTAPMRSVVSTLDAYFERLAGPIATRGGEILKFMGDAVLAVFPIHDDGRAACAAAFQAAREGIAAVEALGDELAGAGGPRVRAGAAIHRGRVLYGNIGAQQRLDFTVIGPAVNEASRIEGLCKPLGESVLVSDEAARLLDPATIRSVGSHALKGIRAARELFAPAASARDR